MGELEGPGLMRGPRDTTKAALRRFSLVVACFAALIAIPVQAEIHTGPTGHIILTVTGNISVTNAKNEARFDTALLESLGGATLVTSTPWTDGTVKFEGVWARDLLEAVRATGDKVVAVALNDYQVEIPLEDLNNQNVLLVLKMNGTYMRVWDKGPVWIIYPSPPSGEARDMATRAKMIWQLKRLEIARGNTRPQSPVNYLKQRLRKPRTFGKASVWRPADNPESHCASWCGCRRIPFGDRATCGGTEIPV